MFPKLLPHLIKVVGSVSGVPFLLYGLGLVAGLYLHWCSAVSTVVEHIIEHNESHVTTVHHGKWWWRTQLREEKGTMMHLKYTPKKSASNAVAKGATMNVKDKTKPFQLRKIDFKNKKLKCNVSMFLNCNFSKLSDCKIIFILTNYQNFPNDKLEWQIGMTNVKFMTSTEIISVYIKFQLHLSQGEFYQWCLRYYLGNYLETCRELSSWKSFKKIFSQECIYTRQCSVD